MSHENTFKGPVTSNVFEETYENLIFCLLHTYVNMSPSIFQWRMFPVQVGPPVIASRPWKTESSLLRSGGTIRYGVD